MGRRPRKDRNWLEELLLESLQRRIILDVFGESWSVRGIVVACDDETCVIRPMATHRAGRAGVEEDDRPGDVVVRLEAISMARTDATQGLPWT